MAAHRPEPSVAQEVRFCRTDDGARLAWARHGSGPPVVLVSCWLSHLQHDWQSPVWRHFLDELGKVATVIRYDERGFGLSDWDVADFSYQARLRDLETLVEHLGLEEFSVLGMSGGAPVAIGYAADHPERVERLVLYGALAAGCFGATPDDEAEEAFLAMTRAGWARPDSLFRRVFTSVFIPDATEEQMVWLDELQRVSTSTENAVASRIARRLVQHVGLHGQGGSTYSTASPRSPHPPWCSRRAATVPPPSGGGRCSARRSRTRDWWRWSPTTTSCWPTSWPGRSSATR